MDHRDFLAAVVVIPGPMTAQMLTSAAMSRHEIQEAPGAPRAIGPYSPAVKAGNLVFCSGQIALDPSSGELLAGDIRAQTERVLLNLKAVLEAAGSSLDRVVRTTVYLIDLGGEFAAMNEVYGRIFGNTRPARTTIEVSKLPKGGRIEIDAIATV
jgi:2-iminobutanoate/2-iminopropanoate deaminase